MVTVILYFKFESRECCCDYWVSCGAAVICMSWVHHAAPTKDGNANYVHPSPHPSLLPQLQVIALPVLSSPSPSIYLDASAKDSQRLLKAFKLLHPRFQCHVISCRAKRDDPPDPARTPAPLGEVCQTNKANDAESPFGMFECICVSTLKSHSRRLDK